MRTRTWKDAIRCAFRHRAVMWRLVAGALVPALGGCHHDVTIAAPDVPQTQIYRLQWVNNSTPPVKVKELGMGGTLWVVDAQLVPVDLNRGTDGRIFDDRSGNSTTGGNTRDSSDVAGRVSDVRVIQERLFNTIVAQYRDSIVVNVVRRGDTLFLQRELGVARFAYMDTAWFYPGILVMHVQTWISDLTSSSFGGRGTITYAVTRPGTLQD